MFLIQSKYTMTLVSNILHCFLKTKKGWKERPLTSFYGQIKIKLGLGVLLVIAITRYLKKNNKIKKIGGGRKRRRLRFA